MVIQATVNYYKLQFRHRLICSLHKGTFANWAIL